MDKREGLKELLARRIFGRPPVCNRRRIASARTIKESPSLKPDWCTYCHQWLATDQRCPIRAIARACERSAADVIFDPKYDNVVD